MDKIAEALRETGRPQRDFYSRLGLTQSAFSDRMRGRTRWSLPEAMTLADILGVSLDDLVGRDQDLDLGFELAEEVPA